MSEASGNRRERTGRAVAPRRPDFPPSTARLPDPGGCVTCVTFPCAIRRAGQGLVLSGWTVPKFVL